MTVTDQEWKREQQRVDEVIAHIGERIGELEREVGSIKSDAREIREHFWDEVTVNFSNPEDVTETFFSMKQQADVLEERDRSRRHAERSLDKLRRLHQSPYFGRIDFRDGETRETEQVYLGIGSFRLPDSDTFLIYDWRAPISSLYYDYPPGPAAYETPGGTVEGELLVKRQFLIRNGVIRLLFDTGVTIGDELLQQVLSRSSDAQMKSIVATIQKEQNRIIRNDRSRMLIVQGAAGSGKTSAALQRVAYLLYKHRDNLRADQMVLFSPNPMFNSYVASVLPELGEENMQQATFQEYLERRLGREFELEDPFDQLEYVLTEPDSREREARLAGIRHKSSAAFLAVMKRYVELLEREGMRFRPVKFRGSVIVSAAAIAGKFYSFDPSVKLANRLLLLKDWLLEQVAAFEIRERKAPWVEDAIQLLDNEAYQRAYVKLRKTVRRSDEAFDDFDKERELLGNMVVEEHLRPVRKRIKALRFADVRAVYRQLYEDPDVYAAASGMRQLPDEWEGIAAYTLARIDEGRLPYEDITPYLFLNERMKGFRTNTAIRYVLIDEAQDYSPFQLEFLKWLFPRARMTALGDPNQSIYAGTSALQHTDPLTGLYGEEHTERIVLHRSYRSTMPIVEFTRGMVQGGEAIVPFERPGDKPVVERIGSRDELHEAIAARIRMLEKEGYESIAVICKTAEESAAAHRALQERVEARLVTKSTPTFERGIQVIPAYMAKGVEFDAVLLYDGSAETYGRESERKLLYTACTRAMHLLHIYTMGDPSPFIAAQPKGTYIYRERAAADAPVRA